MKAGYMMGAAALALVAGAGQAQDQVSPDVRWAQVSACAAERSAASRHACVDAVLRASGALDPVTEAAVDRENFGRDERPAPPPPVPQVAAAPARAAVPPVEPAARAAPPPVSGIDTRVASARMAGDRKVVVTTVEGAIWRQTDSDLIRRLPRAGESFEVREGALGSYRCTFNGDTSFRCERRD